jgi:hypothetical protein
LVPPAPDGAGPELAPAFVRDDPVLNSLAYWQQQARATVVLWQEDLGRGIDWYRRIWGVGIGVAAVADAPDDEDLFPVVGGYRFGIVFYAAGGLEDVDLPVLTYLRAPGDGTPVPVMARSLDLTSHSHPIGGRSAALLKKNGDEYLLTAGHNVRSIRKGNPVPLHPNSGFSNAPLFAKTGGCVDAALIGPLPQSHSTAQFPLGPSTTIQATAGQTIDLRLGSSSAPVQATVMQSFLHAQPYLSVAQANNFLFDTFGVPGDSGAAITTAHGDAVGLYLGEATVEDRNGVKSHMGFGLDIIQCLNLFKATLEGALL